jgi:hypothetical protein
MLMVFMTRKLLPGVLARSGLTVTRLLCVRYSKQIVLKVCTGEFKGILPHLLTVAFSVQRLPDKTRRSRLLILNDFHFLFGLLIVDAGDPGHIGAEAGEQGPLRLVLGGDGTAQHL